MVMTPLERAARGLEEALREPVNRMWAKPDSEGIEPGDYLSAARAVLNAIREPSVGMAFAGNVNIAALAKDIDPGSDWTDGEFGDEAARTWMAMVDEILEPTYVSPAIGGTGDGIWQFEDDAALSEGEAP